MPVTLSCLKWTASLGTDTLLQPIHSGSTWSKTPVGIASALKGTQEDPARLQRPEAAVVCARLSTPVCCCQAPGSQEVLSKMGPPQTYTHFRAVEQGQPSDQAMGIPFQHFQSHWEGSGFRPIKMDPLPPSSEPLDRSTIRSSKMDSLPAPSEPLGRVNC